MSSERAPGATSTDGLEERIARLEVRLDEDRKSRQRRVAAYAGLLALFISISTGSISLYNAFFVAPELERKAQAQKISIALREFNSRATEVGSLPDSAPDAQRFVAMNGLNVARNTLVAEIRASDAKIRSHLNAPDLTSSAWVIADNGEFGLSREIAEIAVQKAAGLLEWTSAMNTLARSVMLIDEAEGTALYDELFSRIKTDTSPMRWNLYAVSASTEVHALAWIGKCEELINRVATHADSLRMMQADHWNQTVFLMAAEGSESSCRAAGDGSR